VPPSTELLHLDCDPGEIGRNHPTSFGAYGDVKASLAALVLLVRERVPFGCFHIQPVPKG
jgi:thiamine pyrophosphate-dependent acetolactate synthase large subunit-like protein